MIVFGLVTIYRSSQAKRGGILMRASLQELLAGNELVVADGGMGTMLIAAGLASGQAPERWNTEQPEAVRAVHAAYIQAGAQIILTNTFGGNRIRLDAHRLADQVTETNLAAARLAREEADTATHPVVMAGSIGPTGAMMEPLGPLSASQAVSVFEEQARALLEGGVDVFWIETMADLEEVRAAVQGCHDADATVPVVVTMTFDTRGRTMIGTSPEQAIDALSELGVAAVGANCGNGLAEIESVIEIMHNTDPQIVLVAKSNAGLPRMDGGRIVYDATPEDMAAYARRVQAVGARIIGACCGSTPDHIRAIAGAVREKST
jgi:5-methyltetrahydrofolate--homocysteine methyltransferase